MEDHVRRLDQRASRGHKVRGHGYAALELRLGLYDNRWDPGADDPIPGLGRIYDFIVKQGRKEPSTDLRIGSARQLAPRAEHDVSRELGRSSPKRSSVPESMTTWRRPRTAPSWLRASPTLSYGCSKAGTSSGSKTPKPCQRSSTSWPADFLILLIVQIGHGQTAPTRFAKPSGLVAPNALNLVQAEGVRSSFGSD